jgi:predicted small integral membrane protein
MTLRLAKIALVFTVAFYTSLIALNNLFDYDSNFQYVRHVLMMDSTFPGNRGMWRALNSPMWHDLFYWTIILWEIGSAALCWWGGIRLTRASVGDADEFQQAKSIAIAGLTVNLLLWAVAFLAVGGEWFLMWQSQTWDGEASAFRMFTIAGIVLLLLAQPEAEKENS